MAKTHSLHKIINELVDRTNTDTQRIRHLESWEKGLDMRLKALEEETLNLNRNLQALMSEMETGFKKRDKGIAEMQMMVKEIVKQLKRFVRTDKIAEIQAMLDLYSPLKSNFVTREEVEQIISKRLTKGSGNNK